MIEQLNECSYTLFSPKIQFVSIFYLNHVNYLYLLNYPYLGTFTLNCPDFTICAIFTLYMHSSMDYTSVQNFRAIGPLFMDILHLKDLGDTSVVSECSLGVNLVIDKFVYVVSDTYCILKIWGIQVSSANAVWVLI